MSSTFQPILKNILFIILGVVVWIIANETLRFMVIQYETKFPVFLEPLINEGWPLIPVLIFVIFLIRIYIEVKRQSATSIIG